MALTYILMDSGYENQRLFCLASSAKGAHNVALTIQVPVSLDVVRLPINLSDLEKRCLTFDHSSQIVGQVLGNNPEPVMLLGYPHGFSAHGKSSPEPIRLRRHIAAMSYLGQNTACLLDGAGVPGMSGCPVLDHEYNLVGMYTGLIYPDYRPTTAGDTDDSSKRENDKFAALGLLTQIVDIENRLSKPKSR